MNTLGRRVTGVLGAVALAGSVALALHQRSEIARAEADHQALAADRSEAERLEQENSGLEALRAAHDEAQRLQQPNKRELARLRNELSQFRRLAAEAARLRAENEHLASAQSAADRSGAVPANFIPNEQMADMGLGSPEATVETYLYAMTQGNAERLFQCMGNPPGTTPDDLKNEADFLKRQFASFPGYFIAEINIRSADEEQLDVRAVAGGVSFPVHLVRNGNEWNVKP